MNRQSDNKNTLKKSCTSLLVFLALLLVLPKEAVSAQLVYSIEPGSKVQSSYDEPTRYLTLLFTPRSEVESVKELGFYSSEIIDRLFYGQEEGKIRLNIFFKENVHSIFVNELQAPARIVIDVSTRKDIGSAEKSAPQPAESPFVLQHEEMAEIDTSEPLNKDHLPHFIYSDLVLLKSSNPEIKNLKNEHAKKAIQAFMMGHEAKALHYLQVVLSENPTLLDSNRNLLFAFAELSFLAKRYEIAETLFAKIQKNFRGSFLASIAKIRQIDLDIVRGETRKESQNFDLLSAKDPNVQALALVRDVFYYQKLQDTGVRNFHKWITNLQNRIDHPITKFYLDVAFGQKLASQPIQSEADFQLRSSQYEALNKYNIENSDRVAIKEATQKGIAKNISDYWGGLENQGNWNEIAGHYDSLPDELKQHLVAADLEVNLLLSRTMRSVGRGQEAVPFLKNINMNQSDPVQAWIAAVYLSVYGGESNPQSQWEQLTPEQKAAGFKPEPFREYLPRSAHLRSVFMEMLKTREVLEKQDREDLLVIAKNSMDSPAVEKEAMELFKKHFPQSENMEELRVWRKTILDYADKLRRQNDLADAGRNFVFAGAEGPTNLEKSAASLYRGGLLLYRSGQRTEAVAAFRKCSELNDQTYYANLCLERLDRLDQ